jgi:hypothetical protein
MTTFRAELGRHAGHPAVQAASAVWGHLAVVIGLNLVFTAAFMVTLTLAATGAVFPAVLVGVVLVGAGWGILSDAAVQIIRGNAHVKVGRMAVSARRGIALAVPCGATILASQAALHMSSVGPGHWLRTSAVVVDLLVLGSLIVVLPAATADLSVSCQSTAGRWLAAAERTGPRPFRTLETLAVVAAIVRLGLSVPLVALLIGPMVVATYAAASFIEPNTVSDEA